MKTNNENVLKEYVEIVEGKKIQVSISLSRESVLLNKLYELFKEEEKNGNTNNEKK